MSRTYRCTNGESKKIKKIYKMRMLKTANINSISHSTNIDSENGIIPEDALKLRSGTHIYGRGHNKFSRKLFRKQEKSKFKTILHTSLSNNTLDDVILIPTNKNFSEYT